MAAAPGGFDFLRHAEVRKCHSRKARYTLLKEAERKSDQRGGDPTPENTLITKNVLDSVLTGGKLYPVIRCGCSICLQVTEKTPPQDDKDLSDAIARSHRRQRLFATLAFMGGTFAGRHLAKHELNTVEETLTPDRAELLRSMFLPFRNSWNPSLCCHTERHTRNDSLLCLQEDFLGQLRSAAWILRIPDFQANNLLKHFGERVNTPFVQENRLPISNRGNGREFFSFKVHSSYCDEKLKNRLLFRKQLSIDTPDFAERSKQESDIVRFLKDIANPNIAEVLFAFQETHPPRLNLVFDFHPTDLQRILFPKLDPNSIFEAPEKTLERFPGSPLDHWLWIGVLGVFDAVAAIHDPQNYTSSLPHSATTKSIGGHFDIKPANIVIDSQGRFLLTDFGQAFFKNIKIGQESNFSIYPGTLDYRPPRSYSKAKSKSHQPYVAIQPTHGEHWSRDYDVWSLACIAVEVLTLIVYGVDAPRAFYEERKNDDPQGLGTFWKTINWGGTLKDVLKDSVRKRLSDFRHHGDPYLARVAEQVEKMFDVERSKPVTVKECHQELSASVKVDRYLFKGQNDELIAGEGTYTCLRTMRTSFSIDRVSPLRCSLYLWRNPKRDRYTLTLEFAGSDNQIIVTPCSTRARSDEIIPLAFFDPDIIFDQNRFRTNGLFLQCAFRNMHDGVTFHFARREQYHHFLGAFTHQYICPGSEFRFKSCVIESASKMNTKTWTSASGHFQVWMTLTQDTYDGRYRHARAPSVPSINFPQSPTMGMPQSPRLEDSSSNSSASINNRYSRAFAPANPHFRLALYLCGQPNRALAVVSLTHDTYDISFDRSRKTGVPRMLLERKSRQDILAAVFESPEPASTPVSQESFGPSHTVDEFPGIPMSEQNLSEALQSAKGLRRVEVEFWNEDDQTKFRKYYRTKFP